MIDNNPFRIEIDTDTGAVYFLISKSTFESMWPTRKMSKSDVRLCTYSGEPLLVLVLGCLQVTVDYRAQHSTEPFQVVSGTGPNLLVKICLNHIKNKVNHVTLSPYLCKHSCTSMTEQLMEV